MTPPITWQPIETAPKDGTRVLLVVRPEGYGPVVCGGCFMVRRSYRFDQIQSESARWEFDLNYGGDDRPSHWMPLPDLPEMSDA
jgi:hypothetical protein